MKNYISIKLNEEMETLVSYDTWRKMKLDRFTWKPMPSKRYAYTSLGGTVLLHRMILSAQPGQQIDHINRDGLDNRDENLRFSTQSQNMCNRRKPHGKGYKGVFWSKGAKKWHSMIMFQKTRYHLGYFAHSERAAEAYDRAALALHKEFAFLNFEDKRSQYKPKMPTPCRPSSRKAIPSGLR